MVDENLKDDPVAARKEIELRIERVRQDGNTGPIEDLIKDPNLSPDLKSRAEDTLVACLAQQATLLGASEDLPTAEALLMDETSTTSEAAPAEGDSASRTSTLGRLAAMPIMEKLKLALFGTKEERFILIRSANKIIATTVLKSPKLSESEVELIAQMRNISQDVLQSIASKREWTSNYKVALALVKNPRTPTGAALQLLNRMTAKDLMFLSRDRSITEVVRKTAARIMVKKQAKRE
jgi:hypothetical protein